MARHYFASSALVKLYHNEPGTSVVERIRPGWKVRETARRHARIATLDSIQLAVAADLWRNRLIDSFVVADKVLAAVAALQSLSVIEPRP